jgi:hypothetical protein
MEGKEADNHHIFKSVDDLLDIEAINEQIASCQDCRRIGYQDDMIEMGVNACSDPKIMLYICKSCLHE